MEKFVTYNSDGYTGLVHTVIIFNYDSVARRV